MAASDVKIVITGGTGSYARSLTLDNTAWRIPSDGLDGFSGVSGTLGAQEGGSVSGGVVTGYHTGITQRTIKAEAPATREIRDQIASVLALGYGYTVRITYKGVTRSFAGTLSHLQVSEGNIYQPTELTATFDCPDPFMYGDLVSMTTSVEAESTDISMTPNFSFAPEGQYEPYISLYGSVTIPTTISSLASNITLTVTVDRRGGTEPFTPAKTVVTGFLQYKDEAIYAGKKNWSMVWTRSGLSVTGLVEYTRKKNSAIGKIGKLGNYCSADLSFQKGALSASSLELRYTPTWGGI